MRLIRDRLSIVGRLIGVRATPEPGTKADSYGREDGKTGTLSFLSGSGGGFSGECTALTFEVFPDVPDADPLPPSQKSTLLPW